MPRRPTSDDAVRTARFFLENFIERTDSQDHILPKNDTFSPFCGFCRVFPEVRPSQRVLRAPAARADVWADQFSFRRKRMAARQQTACHVQPSTRFASSTSMRACANPRATETRARWSRVWRSSAGTF